MIDTAPPPASRARQTFRFLREVCVYCTLIAAFSLSLSILVEQWDPPTEVGTPPRAGAALEAILLRRGDTLEAYGTESARGSIRAIELPPEFRNTATPVRLLSARAVALETQEQTLVRDMGSPYAYAPLPGSAPALVHTNRGTSTVYALRREGTSARLAVISPACGPLAAVPLPESDSWYAPSLLFDALGIRMQRLMRLSPAETALAVLDHTAGPRLTVIDLMQRTARPLRVPGFAREQLHFSPLFIDEDTLIFSVLDRTRAVTVRYHRSADTYAILSDAFTDRPIPAADGTLLLLQSYYGDRRNTPFGSLTLLAQTFSLPLRQIEAIVSILPAEERRLLQHSLFQSATGASLAFKTALSDENFNAIQDPDVREQLRSLWLEQRARIAASAGAYRILRVERDGAQEQVATLPFAHAEGRTVIAEEQDVERLMTFLRLPQPLMAEYRRRSAGGVRAEIVDAM